MTGVRCGIAVPAYRRDALYSASVGPSARLVVEDVGPERPETVSNRRAEARWRAHAEFGVVLEHEVEFLGGISLPAL